MASAASSYTTTLQRFQRGYQALFALLEDYPDALYEHGGAFDEWSPRQLVAHLTGWLLTTERQFDAVMMEAAQPDLVTGGDSINTQAIEARAGQNWLDTATELREVFARFERKAAELSPHLAVADPRYMALLDGAWKECITQIGHLISFVSQPR